MSKRVLFTISLIICAWGVFYTLRWHRHSHQAAIFSYYNACLNEGVLLTPHLYQVANNQLFKIDDNKGKTAVLLLTPIYLLTETTQADGTILIKYYQRIGCTWHYKKMINWSGDCAAYELGHLEMSDLGADSAFYLGCGRDWVRWDLTTSEPYFYHDTPLPSISVDTGRCVWAYKDDAHANPLSIALVEHLHQCIVYWNNTPIDTLTYQPVAVPTYD